MAEFKATDETNKHNMNIRVYLPFYVFRYAVPDE